MTDAPTMNQFASNRWSIGFFFALVAFPFIAVWTITQGPKVMDHLFPVYEVVSLGAVESTAKGLTFHDVTIRKNHDCRPNGLLYLSTIFADGDSSHEMLIPAERADGRPFVVQPLLDVGAEMTTPEMRFIMTKQLIDKIHSVRLVIPCHRPLIGDTRAYTNAVLLGG